MLTGAERVRRRVKRVPRSCRFWLAMAGTLELTLSSEMSLEGLNRGVIISDFHFRSYTLAARGGDCGNKEAEYEAVAAYAAKGDRGQKEVEKLDSGRT